MMAGNLSLQNERRAWPDARCGFAEPQIGMTSRSIFLFERDLFGKPVPTFPDHALD